MDERKVYSKVPIVDYRMMRPKVYFPTGGQTVYQSQPNSVFILEEECGISFFTPNGVTLFINKARKEYNISNKLYMEVVKEKVKPKLLYTVQPDMLPHLFDYFESIQSCIIMIYTAVEALCNVAIPDDFTLTKKNNKGITEIWDKANIEKWIPTEEKVGKIVPAILKIESPKLQIFWENFKKLKGIRDEIIHQKHSAILATDLESAFLSQLLNETIFEKIKAGFDLIQYFCDKNKTHTYFPMLNVETQVGVQFVDNANQIPGYHKGDNIT